MSQNPDWDSSDESSDVGFQLPLEQCSQIKLIQRMNKILKMQEEKIAQLEKVVDENKQQYQATIGEVEKDLKNLTQRVSATHVDTRNTAQRQQCTLDDICDDLRRIHRLVVPLDEGAAGEREDVIVQTGPLNSDTLTLIFSLVNATALARASQACKHFRVVIAPLWSKRLAQNFCIHRPQFSAHECHEYYGKVFHSIVEYASKHDGIGQWTAEAVADALEYEEIDANQPVMIAAACEFGPVMNPFLDRVFKTPRPGLPPGWTENDDGLFACGEDDETVLYTKPPVRPAFLMDGNFAFAIDCYAPWVQKHWFAMNELPPLVVANLIVAHIMSCENAKAEEIMNTLEESVATDPKNLNTMLVVNTVIGLLYCLKGKFQFGMDRFTRGGSTSDMGMQVEYCMAMMDIFEQKYSELEATDEPATNESMRSMITFVHGFERDDCLDDATLAPLLQRARGFIAQHADDHVLEEPESKDPRLRREQREGPRHHTSVVIEDVHPIETWNPTDRDVLDYFIWLGLNPTECADLAWLAMEGLRSPLPEPWVRYKSQDGKLYYFDSETGESRWNHPVDDMIRERFLEAGATLSLTDDLADDGGP